VEKLELDSVYGALGQILHGFRHHEPVLAGQAQYDMDNDGQAGCLKASEGVLKHRKSVTTADKGGGGIMDGLEAQLHPYRFHTV